MLLGYGHNHGNGEHPEVQLTQYKDTFLYFANAFVSSLYLISEPILMLAGYNLFNNWNFVTIVWFIVYWFMGLYSFMLVVATVDIQAYMLALGVYFKGFALIFLLVNVYQFMITLFFLAETMQFKIVNVGHRTPVNDTSLDLTYWSML